MTKPDLYARDGAALLPILEPLLPASIVLVGSIHSNPTLEVYATFPADPPDEWMAIAVLPGAAVQMRLFHSLEASPLDDAQRERGQATVNAVVGEMLRRYPAYKLGAVHEAWAEALRRVVGGRHHTLCTTWLAPSLAVDASGAKLDGLVLDTGRAGDEVLVRSTRAR
jgi:hypothetical protein